MIALTSAALERYVGTYKVRPDSRSDFTITSDGKQLTCTFGKERARVDLVPHSTTKFSMRWTAAHVIFDLDEAGRATAMSLHVAGGAFTVKRME